MSGLLLGILLARSAASFVAEWLGWRAIYLISAALMVVLVFVLRRMLPEYRPAHVASYRALLASTVRLPRELPVLRWRALTQACMFGTFTAYWTAIAYELIDEHHLNQAEIGVFALVGAAGAAAAPLGGWLADRGHGRAASGAALAAGRRPRWPSRRSGSADSDPARPGRRAARPGRAVPSGDGPAGDLLAAPEARARINTVYMTTVFLGGAISSAIAGALHSAYGWTGVCWFGAALPLVGFGSGWPACARPSRITDPYRAACASERISDARRLRTCRTGRARWVP